MKFSTSIPAIRLALRCSLAWAVLSLWGAVAAAADTPLWNAYLITQGHLQPDGRIKACATAGARLVDESRCVIDGFYSDKTLAEKPRIYSLQDLLVLRLRSQPTVDQRATAIGVGPIWREASHYSTLDPDRFVIFYRVDIGAHPKE